MINVLQILVRSVRPYNMSPNQILSHLDHRKQSYESENFL